MDKTRKIGVKIGFRGHVSDKHIRKVLAEKLIDAIEKEIYDLMKVIKDDDFFAGDVTYRAYVEIIHNNKNT